MRPNCHTLNILFLSKESLKALKRGRKMGAKERREREKSGRQENWASASKNILKREREEIHLISRSSPFPPLWSAGLPTGRTVLSGLCEVPSDSTSPALHVPPWPVGPGGFVSNTCPISRWQLAVRRIINDSGAIGVERNVKCQLTPAHRQEALPQGPRLLAPVLGSRPQAVHATQSHGDREGGGWDLACRPPQLSLASLSS